MTGADGTEEWYVTRTGLKWRQSSIDEFIDEPEVLMVAGERLLLCASCDTLASERDFDAHICGAAQ